MATAAEWVERAVGAGWDAFCGVPCSYLTPLIDHVAARADLGYLPLSNEGEAVAFACGQALAGRRPVVMFQNSGLGNAVSPLTSLARLFGLPLLLVVTWRGEPGRPDAPQHDLMGAITPELLTLMGIPHERAPAEPDQLAACLGRLAEAAAHGPAALVLPKGVVTASGDAQAPPPAPRPGGVAEPPEPGPAEMSRGDALEILLEILGEENPVVATTGMTGRQLCSMDDRPGHFYMVGSMGCASSLALGVARAWRGRGKVVALDGDGAALMRLEAMAGVGAHGPDSLLHVLLDNGVHDSTGGQPTLAGGVDFLRVATALGYRHAACARSPARLRQELVEALAAPGPRLLQVRIRPGTPSAMTRPELEPAAYATRFADFLRGTAG